MIVWAHTGRKHAYDALLCMQLEPLGQGAVSSISTMSHPTVNHENSRSVTTAQKLKDIFKKLQDINLEGQIVNQETEQLGLGSSCDVFRARSSKHNKTVAVKRIRFFLLDDISFASVCLIVYFFVYLMTRVLCRISEEKCVYGRNSAT